MEKLYIFHVLFLLLLFSNSAYSLIDGLYCGTENCYSVLDVNRESTKAEIAKAYRYLAKKYHPDMHKTPVSIWKLKKEAEKSFTLIATAYEVLKDEESRKDYDYMLDNPDIIYSHYLRYYRRRVAPKVDVNIVVAVTITVISVVQYLGAWSRYKTAIDYLITVPKYRIKALEIAKQENLLAGGKKRDKRSKDQFKEEAEAILKKILEERIDIRGGYSRPSLCDVLWKWKLQKEADLKAQYAESARYKSNRRMMKNQGVRQITFGD
ncbi:dnaJ homolog subfamily C member 25 [Caerostris extrusa]|uniref:DnaJ homolog subfamily C member 25 n=1 Tax=Caerostris extrusa TaxID=172846 RepID=A0AAV4M795_CAEEX|nr:dnaJ homolog subfamily C member 25 [Caerostris extrusa]